MKVVHLDEAKSIEPEPGWKRASLCDAKEVSVERFVKPPRHASPMHDHPNAQVCVVVSGRMRVATASGVEEVLEAGDAAYFPGGEPHMVENLLDEPSVGVEVFCPGRAFDFWLERLKKG